jgi:hypothetical protein
LPVGARGEIHGLEWLSTAPRKKQFPIKELIDAVEAVANAKLGRRED